METMNGMSLSKYNLLLNCLVAYRMTCLEENYTRLLNHSNFDNWKYYNELIPLQ